MREWTILKVPAGTLPRRILPIVMTVACGAALPQQTATPVIPADSASPPGAATPSDTEQPLNEAELARRAAEAGARSRGWFLLPSVGLTETVTDNALLEPSGSKHADLISDASAGVTLFVRTARLSADGDYRLDLLDYARGYGHNQLQPSGTLNATWTAVDPHLFIETGVTSTRVMSSPLGPGAEAGSSLNTMSETTLRLAPRIEGEIGTGYRYLLRSENGYTHSTASLDTSAFGSSALSVFSQRPNTYTGRHSAELEGRPQPLGWVLSAEREQTRFAAPIDELMTTDTARLIPRYRFGPELLLGTRVGYQSNNFGLTSGDRQQPIFGGDLMWKPSPRTTLSGFAETRPFGPAWQVELRSRGGVLGLSAQGSRATTTAAQSQFQVSGLGDLRSVVDSIYLASVPDPVQRGQLVQQLLAGLGVAGTSVAPLINLFLPALTRVEQGKLTVFVLTPRNLASLTLYGQRNEVLLVDGAAPTRAEYAFGAFRQLGATLALTHRLTPRRSVSLTGDAQRAQGLTVDAGDQTWQRTVTLQLNQTFSKRLDAVGGLRHRSITSTVFGDAAENEIFGGVVYRP
jgi:uncharacterized protein (PEP-CTERM system associated)